MFSAHASRSQMFPVFHAPPPPLTKKEGVCEGKNRCGWCSAGKVPGLWWMRSTLKMFCSTQLFFLILRTDVTPDSALFELSSESDSGSRFPAIRTNQPFRRFNSNSDWKFFDGWIKSGKLTRNRNQSACQECPTASGICLFDLSPFRFPQSFLSFDLKLFAVHFRPCSIWHGLIRKTCGKKTKRWNLLPKIGYKTCRKQLFWDTAAAAAAVNPYFPRSYSVL